MILALRTCVQETVLSSLDKKPLKGFKQRSDCVKSVLCRRHCSCIVQRDGRQRPSWEAVAVPHMGHASGTGNEGSCKDLNDGI